MFHLHYQKIIHEYENGIIHIHISFFLLKPVCLWVIHKHTSTYVYLYSYLNDSVLALQLDSKLKWLYFVSCVSYYIINDITIVK